MKNKFINNKLKYIFIIIFLVLIVFLISLFIYNNLKKHKENDNLLLNEIKQHYNIYVKVNNKADIYCENIKICGNIEKDMIIELEQNEIKDTKNKYFKIKNTNYFIHYLNVSKDENINNLINNKYIPFNYNIKTKDTVFLKNDKEVLKVNGEIEFEVKLIDDKYYYVSYMNNILGIKKENVEILNIEKEQKESLSIPVLYFLDKDLKKLTEKIVYLKENNYNFIDINDYLRWQNKYIRLDEKTILLLSDEELNIEDIIINNNSLSLLNSNIVSSQDKINNNYIVKSTTTMDDYKKMINGEKVIEYIPPINNEQKIAILNYHFFYDPNLGENCNESICITTTKFESHLKYLKDNDYKTLTMEEFRAWMYKEKELPKKSVLITIDDGAMGTGNHNGNKLIPLLEKYDAKATLFLITGWWDINNYRSSNLDIQSHTNDMHTSNLCSNQPRGSQLLCSSKEQVLTDLKQSINIVGNNTSFCYPFYAYNQETINSVKELGFKLAFAGGNFKASRSSNKYMIPRYPISKGITLEQFISMVN